MPYCESDGNGLRILLSKQHTVDLHFASGNWGFTSGLMGQQGCILWSKPSPAAKPLCNLGQLNVSGRQPFLTSRSGLEEPGSQGCRAVQPGDN